MLRILSAALIVLPVASYAVGSNDDTPATPTKTTTECTDGMVWDEETEACVAPKESKLDDDTLYEAAREFAHAGQYQDAIGTLEAMSDPQSDRALTYFGFAHRKSGNIELGMSYYAAALSQNPDNLLARSYLGQALAEVGDFAGARAQLIEIRARGGRETWPEFALRSALSNAPDQAY